MSARMLSEDSRAFRSWLRRMLTDQLGSAVGSCNKRLKFVGEQVIDSQEDVDHQSAMLAAILDFVCLRATDRCATANRQTVMGDVRTLNHSGTLLKRRLDA